MPSGIGARHTALQFLKTQENIDRLRRNLKEEHVLKLDWISTLFKHVRLPLRYAVQRPRMALVFHARCQSCPQTCEIAAQLCCPDSPYGAHVSCTVSPRILHLIISSTPCSHVMPVCSV